jgi:phosphopantetheinyl transferase
VTDAPLAIDVVLVDVDARAASPTVDMAARIAIGSRLAVYPTLVAIDHEPNGRPTAEGVALGLSHSGALGAIAITEPGHVVGVDVEAVRPRRYAERIARRIFDADALARWSTLPAEARVSALVQRWTEVEAVLKAQGTGIAGGFASAVPTPRGWSCVPVDVGPGFAGAVAADAPSITVAVRRLGT